MSADEVTSDLLKEVAGEAYSLIVLNYANCDMVGHTGIFDATIEAVETVDRDLSRLIPLALKHGYHILLTADHGNADLMVDPQTRVPFTAHTTNDVPLIYINPQPSTCNLENGRLADIAPTILGILELGQPEEMTGKNLLHAT